MHIIFSPLDTSDLTRMASVSVITFSCLLAAGIITFFYCVQCLIVRFVRRCEKTPQNNLKLYLLSFCLQFFLPL